MALCRIEDGQVGPERDGPPADRLIAGAPVFETWPSYESTDGKHHVGIWRSTPGAWRIRYTEWEYCELLDGVSIVTAADGASWTLRAGDRFVIEPGFEGSWEVVETTTKRYVIRLP